MYARVLENQQELRVIKGKARKSYSERQADFVMSLIMLMGCIGLTIATPIICDGDGTACLIEIPMCLYYMGKVKETWKKL